jgi:origin recognition complex subunit 3
LAQEYGDVINLYEWYQSFKTVLTSASQTPKKKRHLSPASKKAKTLPPPENEAQIQYMFFSNSLVFFFISKMLFSLIRK